MPLYRTEVLVRVRLRHWSYHVLSVSGPAPRRSTSTSARSTGEHVLKAEPGTARANNSDVGTASASASYPGDGNHAPSSDSKTFTIADNTAPNTAIISGPVNPTNANTATLTFSGSDDVTATGSLTFECKLDGGAFASCTSPAAHSSLADGPHTFQARATDGAGNMDQTPASFAWTVDTQAPDTTIASAPPSMTSNTSATFTFTSTEGSASFHCKLDGAAFADCASGITYSGLSNGSHTFLVESTDTAGNTDPTPASFRWTITPPAANYTFVGFLQEEVASGASGLQYLGNGNWQFNWKTDKAWASTCRTVVLKLSDGSTHEAHFQFKR